MRAPTRGNRRLERLLDAVNADQQVKAWWHVSAVNATRRLGMSDHCWVHIQIVLNIGLRLARLLFRRGVVPSVVADYGMSEHDAEVVVAAACLLHCVGMSIHRDDHERYSLFLTADKLRLAAERRLRGARALDHRRRGDARDHRPPPQRRAVHGRGRDRARGRRARHGPRPLAGAVRGRPPEHPLAVGLRDRGGQDLRRGATARSGWRSRCPTAPASSRSTSCWPRSCAAPGWRSTSR